MADQPTFESPEEVHAYYGRLLKDVPEDDPKRVSLELEQARAEAGVYRTREQGLRRQTWVTQALQQFPHAKAEDISGNDEESILQSAKAIHDRIEEARSAALAEREQQLQEQAGRRAYGRAGISGGGAPVQDAESPENVIQRNKTAYEQRGLGAKPESPEKALAAHLTGIVAEKAG